MLVNANAAVAALAVGGTEAEELAHPSFVHDRVRAQGDEKVDLGPPSQQRIGDDPEPQPGRPAAGVIRDDDQDLLAVQRGNRQKAVGERAQLGFAQATLG